MLKHQEIIEQMTLKEKIAFTSGKDSWRLQDFPERKIPKITLSDGPHGLRHQEEGQDHLGINESNLSTAFPPACLTAASFDKELLFTMGQAIGHEALCQNVQVVLGPGVNLKRNPLCGRNFEYFSEDPVVAGTLSLAFIEGVQSMGVGTSLKHFALNNQETNRMKSDSVVDRKAVYDLYLKAFEKPILEGKPYTVMGSYNLVDGVYASEEPWLIGEVLRKEFDFQGVLMTDWGAMNDKKASFTAGLDLEMPGGAGYFDEDLEKSILDGTFEEALLDKACDRILELILKTTKNRQEQMKVLGPLTKDSVDIKKHHELARSIAEESMVLLKNEGEILPIEPKAWPKIHLIGALAKEPRYQGAGSSHIRPYRVSSLKEALAEEGVEVTYHEGYLLSGDEAFVEEACLEEVGAEDLVILAVGLPESYESEGFDRKHMKLPPGQNALVHALANRNQSMVVVLYGGAPTELPWVSKVQGLLNAYLPGQAGGEAVKNVLLGKVNPSGKLAETYPLDYKDVVSSAYYGKDPYDAWYLEGLYMGYRYFDKAEKPVRFPFGFGLSYTTFSYGPVHLEEHKEQERYEITLSIKNTGNKAGKEVVQLYGGYEKIKGYHVKKSLLDFAKVSLAPSEEKEVRFLVPKRALEEYDRHYGQRVLYEGGYVFSVGSSSKSLHGEVRVSLVGVQPIVEVLSPFYDRGEGVPSEEDFLKLLGEPVVKKLVTKPYTIDHTLGEMKEEPQMRYILKKLTNTLKRATGVTDVNDPAYLAVEAMFMQTPVKRLTLLAPDKMPKHLGETLVDVANGEYLKAAAKAVKRREKR
ncbi:MAG TPA: glycosyl hydrolase [Clostridiaceae bacterium]|nr:glycosyl hydrolase [Clostridiaceae bacterium]